MAINPDEFIFHSNLITEERVSNRAGINVAVSGTVAAGQKRSWSSAWFTSAGADSYFRGKVYVPGSVFEPSSSNSWFQLPVKLIYNNTEYLDFIARVEQQNTQYRATIEVFNPYNYAIASPARTFTFIISEYIPK